MDKNIKIGTPIFVRQKVSNFSHLMSNDLKEQAAHAKKMTGWELKRFRRFERHGVVVGWSQTNPNTFDAFYDEYSIEIPIK